MLLPLSQLRKLMHRLHRAPLAVAIVAAALTTAPALAQSKPESSDFSKADSVAAEIKALVPARVTEGQRVPKLDLDLEDESRPATFLERIGFAAILTGVGAGLGYEGWHVCNDPESEIVIRCIIAPRRLETSVRIGAYSGLAVGLASLLGDLKVRVMHSRFRAADPGLLIGHRALSGFRVGVNFRF
jgi:hypothetical protein